jgi:integrase
VAEVYALADAVGLRYRALILLAAFSSLRWGELVALRPDDIDLDACTVRVTRHLNKPGAVPVFGPPKSRAGRRAVDFADLIVPDLRGHLRSGLFEGPSSLLSVVVRRAGGFPTIMSV